MKKLDLSLLPVEPHYLVVEHKTATKFEHRFGCLHHLLWLYHVGYVGYLLQNSANIGSPFFSLSSTIR